MRKRTLLALVLIGIMAASAVLMLGGCGKKAPELTSIIPASGTPGGKVTLNGTNFGSAQEESIVKFGSQTAAVNTWSDTTVEITVPADAAAGVYEISVETKKDVSNSLQFQVTAAPPPPPPAKPVLNSMLPTSGPSNTVVYVYGKYFGGSQGSGKVNLGPVKFDLVSWSDTKIEAKVPPGMGVGQYEVTVQNANGTSNSLPFVVTAAESDAQGQEQAIYQYAVSQGINPDDYVYVKSMTSQSDPAWALYLFQRYEGMGHLQVLLRKTGSTWQVVASGGDDFSPQAYGAPADLKF